MSTTTVVHGRPTGTTGAKAARFLAACAEHRAAKAIWDADRLSNFELANNLRAVAAGRPLADVYGRAWLLAASDRLRRLQHCPQVQIGDHYDADGRCTTCGLPSMCHDY